MKLFVYIILILVVVYSTITAYLYLFQRKLLYFPMPVDPDFNAEEIIITNGEIRLHGWVLHPGKSKALLYFGGNAEPIYQRREFFDELFPDHSIYLINYRGYGNSSGSPTESGLFADALAIYDQLRQQHATMSAYGRSLGSGVAVYLASQRPLEKLILLTPYDNIAALGQHHYPLFPVRLLIKDHYDSASRAAANRAPVLITSAELDRVIPLAHTLALRDSFTRAPVEYHMIRGAAHNDITDFPTYRTVVRNFLQVKPGDS